MQEIFNLSKIKKLVDSENPPAIIVVDTNIIIDVPDFNQWTTTLNEPLFILSDIVLIELEHLKGKKRQVGEPAKFEDAIKGFNWLLEQGDIIGGIHIAEVGWFISIPSPSEDAINEALGKWESLVQVFSKSDIKFLILTRELSKLMPANTVVFYTKDYNLYNIAVTNGFPACRFEDFPMAGIERWIERKKLEPVGQTNTVPPPSAPEVVIMLLSSGAKTYAEMSQISGIEVNALRQAMLRLMRKGKVVKLNGRRYGLRDNRFQKPYSLQKSQMDVDEVPTKEPKDQSRPIIFSPFSDVHKCSVCDWGTQIPVQNKMLGGAITCPKCGNVDKI